jgi:hypothetical protein
MYSSYVDVTTTDWPNVLFEILGIVDAGAFFSPITSKCMLGHNLNSTDSVSREKVELDCREGSLFIEAERTEDIYYAEGIQEYEAREHDHAKVDGKGGGVGDGW